MTYTKPALTPKSLKLTVPEYRLPILGFGLAFTSFFNTSGVGQKRLFYKRVYIIFNRSVQQHGNKHRFKIGNKMLP